MLLHINTSSGFPVYLQIEAQVKQAIAAGALQEDSALPSVRKLAAQLRINPNTVAKAYRELELKGIIESERGSGSFIKAQPPAPRTGEKKARLKTIYLRLLAEAASSGLTESELLNYLKERNVPTS